MATARKAAPRKTAPKAAAEPEIFDPFAGAELPQPFLFKKLDGSTGSLAHPNTLSTAALMRAAKEIDKLDPESDDMDEAISLIESIFPDGGADDLLSLPPEFLMATFSAWFGLLGVGLGESDGSQS